MKKINRICIVLFLLSFFGSVRADEPVKNFICFQNQCIEVELALNEGTRRRGLQHRLSLEEGKGMLFVFPSLSRYSFWMKDTYIPLDMVWIDETHKIVDIKKNVLPCQSDPCEVYTPQTEALYVLEINALHADRWGIRVGDNLNFAVNRGKIIH